MTIQQVRKDLRSIRYYYSKQKDFETAARTVGMNEIAETAERYNAAVRKAPIRLYDVYVSLYIHNNTQLVLALRPYFKTDEATNLYVESNLERKQRNLIMRRIRMTRKANLQTFNFFVTLTYNGELHTEESFKKKLKNTLGHFCTRKDWRYIGVWERSSEKQRLHFHGIFYIPDGTMPGLLFEKSDYNFKSHRRQITVQNTYFNENFGRSDFEKIEDANRLGEAMTYLMKYIEKSGEKIVYSRNLPQYFISDIMDNDVITTIGLEDKKLLLFDDFGCWDEGGVYRRGGQRYYQANAEK